MEPHFQILADQGFDPKKGQFFLHKEKRIFFEEWNHVNLFGWTLEFCKTFGHIRLTDTLENDIGYLIGYPIWLDIKLSSNKCIVLECSEISEVRGFIYELVSGRYFVVLLNHKNEVIFPDAAATIPIVYSAYAQELASSNYLFREASVRSKSQKKPCNNLPDTKFYYPLGMTPLNGNQLLLPNHYLDLRNMVMSRVSWALISPQDSETIMNNISERIRKLLNLLVAEGQNINFLLTGGEDSRMILSCFFPQLTPYIECSTHYEGHAEDQNLVDVNLAEKIAQQFSLNWTSVDLGQQCNPSISNEHITIMGFGGELSRSVFWHEKMMKKALFNHEWVLEILGIPNYPITQIRVRKWLSGLPTEDTIQVLDLLYLELYVGCLISPTLLRFDITSKYALSPFLDWKILNSMAQIPPEIKKGKTFTRSFIKRNAPELYAIQFV